MYHCSDRATTPKSLAIADDALQSLIRWYCREAGVRNLEVRAIGRIERRKILRKSIGRSLCAWRR